MRKKILAIALCAMLCFALVPAGAAENATMQQLTIYFTHDMHSHVEPAPAGAAGDLTGGFSKIAALLAQSRAKGEDFLAVDAGDFTMGTLYQTICQTEASELRLMGAMGFDVTTLGNHEFDYRTDGVTRMIQAALRSGDPLPALVCCNIDWENTLADPALQENAQELRVSLDSYGMQDYTYIQKNGVTVALFGLMGYEAQDYAPQSGLYFYDPLEMAKQVVAQIKAEGKADLIVCLSHGGTNEDEEQSEDEKLALAVPDIDLIISGHSHTTLNEPIVCGNTIIVSAGAYTENLGKITLERTSGRWQTTGYVLISLGADKATLPQMDDTIALFRSQINSEYLAGYGYTTDQILARSDFNLTQDGSLRKSLNEEPLGNLIADSYRYAVQQAEGTNYQTVTVAVEPQGVVRGAFYQGNITVADTFRVKSLGSGANGSTGYPLVSVYLTGKELKVLCEVDASVSGFMSDAQLYCCGIRYTVNPDRLVFNRVTSAELVMEDGSISPIEDDRLYRVVSGLYSAQMLGAVNAKSYGLLSLVPKNAQGEPIEDFELYIIHNQDGSELKEWVALASYLQSFPTDESGISVLPAHYAGPEGRKIIQPDRSLSALLENPNKVFWIALGVVILLLFLLFALISLPIRLLRRRSRRRRSVFR